MRFAILLAAIFQPAFSFVSPSILAVRTPLSCRIKSPQREVPRRIDPQLLASTVVSATASSEVPITNHYRLTASLAFMTGVADVCLIRKYQTFCTMMTGNCIWGALALSEHNFPGVLYYVNVLLSYMTGIVIFRRRSQSSWLAPLVGFLCIASDVWSFRHPAIRWPAAGALACAYGIINSIGTERTGTLAYVVTGHLTRLTHSLSDALFEKKPLNAKVMKQSSIVLGGFLLGAFTTFMILPKCPQILSLGAFSAMGVLYSGLLFWQDRREKRAFCELDEYETSCR